MNDSTNVTIINNIKEKVRLLLIVLYIIDKNKRDFKPNCKIKAIIQ